MIVLTLLTIAGFFSLFVILAAVRSQTVTEAAILMISGAFSFLAVCHLSLHPW